MSTQRMFTIVVAAGTSSRYGSNKLNEIIDGKTVLERSIDTALSVSDGVILVTNDSVENNALFAVVQGGTTRSESVKNGLDAVPQDVEIIAVHDGARPFSTAELYKRGKQAILDGKVAAIPAIDVVDTIKEVSNDEHVLVTHERSSLRSIQTPQIFKSEILRKAYELGIQDTDDAALVEKLGEKVFVFEGERENIKITVPSDMEKAKASSKSKVPRIGYGYDIHPFGHDEFKKLVLGGVQIDHPGLEGHSDSDALCHALTDALLSAIGAPDLGTLFPANNEQYKDASSTEFLLNAVTRVSNEGYVLGNASIVVNAQKPKLSVHLDEIKKSILEICEPISNYETQISITAKHGEGIDDIGQGKAIAVHATVILVGQQ